MDLLTRGASNPKTRKQAEELGIRNVVLHLAPATLASERNVCPFASQGCLHVCLNTAGRGTMDTTQAARVRRTREFWADRAGFVDRLALEIERLARTAAQRGLTPAVRLNGTSDIPWESQRGTDGRTLFERFPGVVFYDYTKGAGRALRSVTDPRWPANYHLTYSRSERDSSARVAELLGAGVSVAVVFADAVPSEWNGASVVDGTTHDFRFLDPRGVVVGLHALGRAARDESGFVVRAAA